MFSSKNRTGVAFAGLLVAGVATTASASYLTVNDIGRLDYTFFPTPTAWDPGANTARIDGFPAPGGATWSIMGAGLSDTSGIDAHGGATTDDITALGFSQATIESYIDTAFNIWDAVSGFTNLGQVADGSVGFGASEASGGQLGDIRIGAINIDGPYTTLAHAFQPGTEAIFGAGGTIAGDIHLDSSDDWVNNFDLPTVLLHELGHSLGLAHSDDITAVMYPYYGGPNLTLSADDIAGIQAIYGAEVPVPGAVLLFMSGIGVLGFFARRRA